MIVKVCEGLLPSLDATHLVEVARVVQLHQHLLHVLVGAAVRGPQLLRLGRRGLGCGGHLGPGVERLLLLGNTGPHLLLQQQNVRCQML